MDSLISAAAQALAVGDPLSALKQIALRDDPAALVLRGTAMAQLGDLVRARALVRRAARAFGPREAVSRARCVVAEAEIALAARDLSWSPKSLDAARLKLEAHGDHVNAAHARFLEIRRLLLIGRVDEAEHALAQFDPAMLPPPLRVVHELAIASIAVRRTHAKAARAALTRAARAAHRAGIPALASEVEIASLALSACAARLIAGGTQRDLRLDEVEAKFASPALIVDACRLNVRQARTLIVLARRPVLFTLARLLAEAWPADVSREVLVAQAFRARRVDETYRARLRVEIGRLRRVLRTVADVAATKRGFAILPRQQGEILVLAPPVEDAHSVVLALLADGESWSTSALALALGASRRTVQRALAPLKQTGKVQAFGRGRTRRWMTAPAAGFTTALLLPPFAPGG